MIKPTTPPNYEAIVARFPAVSQMVMSIVFTHYPDIYVPSGAKLPPDLEIHENTHLRQQKDLGPNVWWEMYLKDDAFRLEQEVEAYANQLLFWRPTGNARFQRVKERLARDLAGPYYDLNIEYHEAESKIRRAEKLLHQAATHPRSEAGAPAGEAVL